MAAFFIEHNTVKSTSNTAVKALNLLFRGHTFAYDSLQ
jgi:hypothetical protein